MTAFEVYLIMQADTLSAAAGLVAVGFAALTIPALDLHVEEGVSWKAPVTTFAVAVLAFLFWLLMPNTKTLAAMYVIPAVTSEHAVEKIAPEVREVWELAKDALREAGKKSEVEK